MKKILIVDDEVVISSQLQHRLTKLGYKVVGTASSGEEAIDCCQKYHPDLVLMDIVMPGQLDGIEASKKIKQQMNIPVLFITAYGDDALIHRAMESDPIGYIIKPFQFNEIRANIEIALQKHEKLIAQEKLQFLINFEKLINQISKNFIQVPSHRMDQEIQEALSLIARYIGADGAFICNLNSQKVIYSYGKTIFNALAQQNPSFYQYLIEKIHHQDCLYSSNIDQSALLAPEVKDQLEQLGLHSFIYCPMADNEGLRNLLGFENVEDTLLSQEDEVPLFLTIRDIYVNAINRKKYEEQLKQALEKAKNSDRLKTAFLANMSHEVRTPLNSILGFVDLILIDPNCTEDMQRNLNYVKESGKSLLFLINEILDLSKIEVGEIKIEPVPTSLYALLHNMEARMQILLGEKKAQIEIKNNISSEIKDYIICDPNRLQQILTNLFTNAIKFTEKGIIEYGATVKSNEWIEFYVKDTGIGIPKDKLDLIFNPFEQGDLTYGKKYGGTGLGLTITKRLLELMGGAIWVDSHPGGGSTFYFQIPYVTTQSLNSQPKNNIPNSIIHKKDYQILIVEDDPINQMLLKEYLIKFGYHTFLAEDGEKTLSYYRRTSDIDLILMDIRLPDQSGLQLIQQIRQWEKENQLPNIPIIIISANALKEDIEKAEALGCYDYLTKPFAIQELLKIIKKYLPM